MPRVRSSMPLICTLCSTTSSIFEKWTSRIVTLPSIYFTCTSIPLSMQQHWHLCDSGSTLSPYQCIIFWSTEFASILMPTCPRPCTSFFEQPMRGSKLMSTCPREAYTDGYRKSVNDAQYLFLDVRGIHLQSSAYDYHASQDRQ